MFKILEESLYELLNFRETDILSRDANVCIVHQPQTKVDLTKYLDHIKFRFDYTFDAEDQNKKVKS